MDTKVSSSKKEVIIGHGRPTVLIGERINPAGKKKLMESLKTGSMELVKQEALAQVKAGADMLDVNVAAFGVDEVSLLRTAVELVMDLVDVPLCIDSANPAALEAALKIYKGKPLINSVTGEPNSLKKILPVVKEYGAAVVGLVQDEDGIPKTADKRFEIASKIVENAEKIGITRDNIIIDCLTLSIGAEPAAGAHVLEAIRRITKELGVNTTMGASNVSFGLPDRGLINNIFVTTSIAAGMTCLIVDTEKIRPSVLAADLILGHDKYARRYITGFRERQANLPPK